MVEITPEAADLLNEVRVAEGVPETFALRFSSQPDANGEPAVGIGLASAPEVTDEVVRTPTMPVYVAPEVAGELENAVLDVETDASSERFVIRSDAE